MNTPVSLMDDQMVDMAFITQLTGLTDRSGFTAHSDGAFRPHQTRPQLPDVKAKWKPGCRRVLHSPVRSS